MGATNPRSIFNGKSKKIKIIVEFYTMKWIQIILYPTFIMEYK